MPKRIIPLINDHYYHIYNRVMESCNLFYSLENYLYFLKLWNEIDFTSCSRLIAYCLMPNHFHFLLKITDAILFPKKISYLFNKYLKFLNASRNESFRYFKNRFKAKWIQDECYLIAVCAYIHLNPVKANLVISPDRWPFSNYLEFIGKRNGHLFDSNFFNQYIHSPSDYEKFITSIYSEQGVTTYLFEETTQIKDVLCKTPDVSSRFCG